MKTSSAKAKGRVLQKYIRDKILEAFPNLTDRDVRSTPMGVTGEDITLSELGSRQFPYSVEAKNQEKIQIWGALKEAESNNRKLTPLLVFKRNHSKVYCCLDFDDFIKIVKLTKTIHKNQKI